MSHPIIKIVKALIGKHVVVDHVEGWSCHGVLQSITRQGIYLRNVQMIETISSSENKPDLEHTISHDAKIDAEQVFFPFLFIPFAALAGVAAASALRPRPPYYYGYPGPYGGYGYGYGPGPYW